MWLLWLGCLSVGGLFLPVFRAGPLALDEHVSYWMLDSEQPGTVLSRCLEYGAVPPLGSWLQYGSMGLFGKNEFALRLPSLVAAGLSIFVVFRIGQQGGGSGSEGGTLCGGVAACLLAWHPDVLDEVRIGRCYGLVVCLSACLVWTTLRWRENVNSWSRSLIWGLSATALLWTHYTSAILVGVTWGFLVLSVMRADRRKEAWGKLSVATLLTGVLCLPLLPAILRLREWSPYLNMRAPETPYWQTVSSFWWWALPLGGVASAVAGWRVSRSPRASSESSRLWREPGGLLLACSLLPLVVIAVCAVGDLSSLTNPRYRVAYAPAGVVWAALLLSRSGSWKAAGIGLLVTLCAAWSTHPLKPWQLGRLGSPADINWRELSLLIAEQGHPGEPILVQCGLVESSLVPAYLLDHTFMEYAACRVSKFYLPTAHPRVALPYFWDEATQQFYQDYLETQSPPALWIACATDTDLNRGSLVGIQQIAEKIGYRVDTQKIWPHAVLLRMTR